MHLTRLTRLIAAWLAVLAVLLAALAPSLTHALGGNAGTSWLEICSAQGSRWVNVDDDASGPAKAAHVFEHCPYCSLQTDVPALPPAADAALTVVLPDVAVAAAFLSASRTLHAWVSAQPRAPPLFS